MPTTYDGILHDEGGAVFNVRNPTYWAAQSGDISGDDAIKIQRAINAASAAGGGTAFIPQGVYTSKSVIRVKSNVTLAGAGAATIIRRDTGFGGLVGGVSATAFLILVEGVTEAAGYATGITIRDLALDGVKGSQTTLSQDYGGSSLLVMSRTERSTVENVWAYNGLYDAIILEYCKDVVLRGCKATGSLKAGIYLSGCNRVMVTNNFVGGNDYPGALLASSWYCTVTGNDFRAGGPAALGYGGLHLGRDSEYCTVTGNWCQGIGTEAEPVMPASVSGGTPTYISDERPDHPAYDSTTLGSGTMYALYNSVIADNVVTGHVDGIRIFRSNRNRVAGNYVAANSAQGVVLYGSSRNVVSGNTLVDNGGSSNWSVLVTPLESELGGPLPADDNVVEDNDIRDDRATPAVNGVRVNSGPARTVIRNNRIATANPISVDSGATGTARYGNYIPSTGAVDGGITP
jgi:parallel beta-helix repeat protein